PLKLPIAVLTAATITASVLPNSLTLPLLHILFTSSELNEIPFILSKFLLFLHFLKYSIYNECMLQGGNFTCCSFLIRLK
ncbi:MAG TPA: hypothetical protein DCR24_02145, partial [Bacillus bacterium]|nr:hypothetical protein [Bacillus sp. (in: firmicutes)]